ncbi:hypothetical protein [Fodinicola feengrottensis]|uniref:hypothetical protein n=1 Tax=Fodinicola feengrottensis TaxID=435914 RepID=UPI0013D1C7C9|nr:hypothetical protein [Fodinicola feengrottensis]
MAAGLLMAGVVLVGGSGASLAFGAAAGLVSLAVLRWPVAPCLVAVVLAVAGLGYGSVTGWLAIVVAAAAGLLAVGFALLGGVRKGSRRFLRNRTDAVTGAVLATLICAAGAAIDSGWGWLAVSVPICLAVVYVVAILVVRQPIRPDPDDPDDLIRGGGGSARALMTMYGHGRAPGEN